jgi:hypothetical protein
MILVRLLNLLLELVLPVVAVLAMIYGFYWIRASFKRSENRGRVPCPHCAELIQPGASICRFCQREVGDSLKQNKTPRGLFQ